jgi:hypothetical protein
VIENYDWSCFYGMLCNLGPYLLIGIDDDTCEMIQEFASSTDMFWSDGLQDLLSVKAKHGDLRAGVISVLELWRENVLQVIDSDLGIELDWKTVHIDTTSPLIDELVDAAIPADN